MFYLPPYSAVKMQKRNVLFSSSIIRAIKMAKNRIFWKFVFIIGGFQRILGNLRKSRFCSAMTRAMSILRVLCVFVVS